MITISKPTAAHWSMACLTASLSDWRTCIKMGFSCVHGAIMRQNLHSASPRRSWSVASRSISKAVQDSKLSPALISSPGPSKGVTSRRAGLYWL